VESSIQFLEGTVVYIKNLGYFRILSKPSRKELTLKLIHRNKDDVPTDQILKGDKLVSSGEIGDDGHKGEQGEKGKRGNRGHKGEQGIQGAEGAKGKRGNRGHKGEQGVEGVKGHHGHSVRAIILKVFSVHKRKSSGEITVEVDHPEVFAVGEVVYIQLVGNFRIVSKPGQNTLVLRFLYRSSVDKRPLTKQDVMVSAGGRGVHGDKGERGINPFSELHKISQVYSLIHIKHAVRSDDFTFRQSSNTNNRFNKLSGIYVKVGDTVHPPANNRNANSRRELNFEASCPAEQVIVSGECHWNIFKFTLEDSPCRAVDFNLSPSSCKINCIKLAKSVVGSFHGEQTELITSVTTTDRTGNSIDLTIHDTSCKIATLRSLNAVELRSCGFFCFFHQLDSFHVSNTLFKCRYVPPSAYGISDYGSSHVADLESTIQTISVDIFCAPK